MLIDDLTEQQTQQRIDEIDKELLEIRDLKRSNRITSEDIEDVSDNYQYHIEWNYAIDELELERKVLIQHRNSFHMAEE